MRRRGLLLAAASLVATPALAQERGTASWYGGRHHGRKMANGRRFNQHAPIVAHRRLPLGSKVEVCNLRNGRCVRATVTDRGPYVKGRVLDVSRGLARRLDMLETGTAPVEITMLEVGR